MVGAVRTCHASHVTRALHLEVSDWASKQASKRCKTRTARLPLRMVRVASLLAPLMALALDGCVSGHYECGFAHETACEERFLDECLAADGCHIEVGCGRVDCNAITAQGDCTPFPTCTWYGTFCSTNDQNPCPGLSQAACGVEPGCVWGDTCAGTPVSCRSFGSEQSCRMISHCYWEHVPGAH